MYTTVKHVGVSKKMLFQVAEITFRQCKKKDAAISIHCVGEKKMRRLNMLFRQQPRPTDVLSFAIHDAPYILDDKEWGDVFLCIPYIRKQAVRFGVPYREELFRMLIHGILHLVGYDHASSREAKQMFSLQEKILALCL